MRMVDLEAVADALEGHAGAATSANPNATGRWSRIATAAEALAGASTSANPNITGYMKRTALALESIAGTTGIEENLNTSGYEKRIVDALEVQSGVVETGSLDRRMVLGAQNAVFTFSVEAEALFARMTVEPSGSRKRTIDTLVEALKTAGTWAKMDALYIMAAHDQQAAKLNWIEDAFNIADPGATAPTFAADGGFTGDGATDYLDTTFNPATAAGLYTQNSCHLGVWIGSNVSGATLIDIGNSSAQINSRASGDVRVKGQSTVVNGPALSGGTSIGWTAWSRLLSTDYDAVRNGAVPTNIVQASTALISLPFYLLAVSAAGPAPTNFSTRQMRAAHFGSGLTDTELADTYAALTAYMAAVGA